MIYRAATHRKSAGRARIHTLLESVVKLDRHHIGLWRQVSFNPLI